MRLPPEGSAHPIPREQGNDCPGSHSRALGSGGGVGAIPGENLGISARSRRFSFLLSVDFLSFCWKPPPQKIPFGNFGVGRKIPELGWDWSSFPGIFGIFDVETLPPSEKNPKKKKFPGKLQSRGLGRDFFFPGYPNIFAPDGIFPAIS